MINTVIFDLDGVLQDWGSSVALAIKDILPEVSWESRFGVDRKLQDAIAAVHFTRRGDQIVDRRYWAMFKDAGPAWRKAMPQAEAEGSALSKRFLELLDVTLYPDAEPALTSLREAYGLGVITRNPLAGDIVRRAGITQLIEKTVSVKDAGGSPGKRDFERLLKDLKAEAKEAAYVGANQAGGFDGAREAGLRLIWVDRYSYVGGPEITPPQGAVTVRSLAELPEALAGL